MVRATQGMFSSGYVEFEDKLICGNLWDMAASRVVCRELGWGSPVEVGGYPKDFFGSHTTVFLEITPICTGKEDSLDLCQMLLLNSTCQYPASVRCRRTSKEDNDIMILDKLPVCAANLKEMELSALCLEYGNFAVGTLTMAAKEKTCKSLTCTSSNLMNCKTSIMADQEVAQVKCSQPLNVQLIGGMQSDRGHILINGSLVCDDHWNLEVSIHVHVDAYPALPCRN